VKRKQPEGKKVLKRGRDLKASNEKKEPSTKRKENEELEKR